MKKIIKKSLFFLGLAAAFNFTQVNNNLTAVAFANTSATVQQEEDIDGQIAAWNDIVKQDNMDWEGYANLSLLYYDKEDYSNSMKNAVKADKLYNEYEITADHDLVRESMVKGAASAYNLGKPKEAKKLLDNMLAYDLKGTKENKSTYDGMANYYLAAMSKDAGDFNQSYTYINNAINYNPGNYYFQDFLAGFMLIDGSWGWRHRHVHKVVYVMPRRYVYVHPRYYHPKPLPLRRDKHFRGRPGPDHRFRVNGRAAEDNNGKINKVPPNGKPLEIADHKSTNMNRETVMHKAPGNGAPARPAMHRRPMHRPPVMHKAPGNGAAARPPMHRPAPVHRPPVMHKAPGNGGPARPPMHRPAPVHRPPVMHKAPANNQTVQQPPTMHRPSSPSTYKRPVQKSTYKPTYKKSSSNSRNQYNPYIYRRRR